jgi:hypothetical protein
MCLLRNVSVITYPSRTGDGERVQYSYFLLGGIECIHCVVLERIEIGG